MKKNRFSRSRTIGFFIGGAVTALKSAVTKTSAQTIASVTEGSIGVTGANFALESLELAANIDDSKKALSAMNNMVAQLSDFAQDLKDMPTSVGEDQEQLEKIKKLIEKRNSLFNSSAYFYSIIDSALQVLLSIATIISYHQLSTNKNTDPSSTDNSVFATLTFSFLFTQFVTHFVCRQKNTHFAQDVASLHSDLLNLQNDIRFLEWQYKTLNRYIPIVQHQLEQLEAQNNGLKERYSKCENELKKIQQITGNLLKERDKIEKEREDTEQQLHGAEQPQRDILRQKLDRLIKEIHDITDELIKSDNRNEKLKIETQNLSGEITINNAEIDQKKSLKEKLIKKASELHNALTEQANKHAEEQLKIMSTLQQNRP